MNNYWQYEWDIWNKRIRKYSRLFFPVMHGSVNLIPLRIGLAVAITILLARALVFQSWKNLLWGLLLLVFFIPIQMIEDYFNKHWVNYGKQN